MLDVHFLWGSHVFSTSLVLFSSWQLRHAQRGTSPPLKGLKIHWGDATLHPLSLTFPPHSGYVSHPSPLPPPTFPGCFTPVEIKLALQKWQRVVTATRHHNSFPKWRKPPRSPRFIIWSCVCGMLGNINTTKYNCYNFPVSPQPALNTRSSASKLRKKSLSLRSALWL